jgi:hypothetical protein
MTFSRGNKRMISSFLIFILLLGSVFGGGVGWDKVSADSGVILIDNDTPGFTKNGFTGVSGSYKGYDNSGNTLYSKTKGHFAKWTPAESGQAFPSGDYKVSIWKTVRTTADNDPAVSVEVVHEGSTETFTLDCSQGSSGWVELGTFHFAGQSEEYVKMSITGSDSKFVHADAVKLERDMPSTNANLSNLTVGEGGSLTPAFSSTVTSYVYAVEPQTSTITVTATTEDSNATVYVNDSLVDSGVPSPPVALAADSNTVTVSVYAQDTSVKKIYTVTVNRGVPAESEPAVLENSEYRITEQEDYSFIIEQKSTGASGRFVPHFTVLSQAAAPSKGSGKITGAKQGTESQAELNYTVLAWGGNPDFHAAPGVRAEHTASSSVYANNQITWGFAAGDGYTLSAELQLPAGKEEPKLTYTLTPTEARYYSIGFTGAPSQTADAVDWIYQPAIWQGKRIPDKAYLTDESRAGVPLVMYGQGGVSTGVAVDPAELPFRLSTLGNSRFGLLLKDSMGNLKPSIYAPIYGGEGSRMSAPFKPYTFHVRLLVRSGDSYDTYKHAAQQLYQFHDYRQNSLTTLNETLDNLTDFIMNRSGRNYSYWRNDYKTNEYINDKPGYGRQQSAVYALGLAMLRDDAEMYRERALPTIEYLASRKTQYVKLDDYDPAYPMGGPTDGIVGDWASLYMMSGGRTPAFKELFNKAYSKSAAVNHVSDDLKAVIDHTRSYTREEALDNAKRWLRPLISAYQMTEDTEYLQDAMRVADDYIAWRINQEPVDYRDTYSSFWNEIGPIYDALFEMFDTTGQERYKNAAVRAMEEFAQFMQLAPLAPEGDVTVSGETVPAWRVSEAGLISEAAGTSNSHRGIFMPYIAGYFARAAEYADDSFLSDIAKANVIGRYANYPGYTLRNNYSTEFEKPGYPLQWYDTYSNTAHMNHPLPMASMVVEYLVSDVFRRSDQHITFPSRFTETGAYFKSKVYGDQPGQFFDDTNVWLWMPKGLLSLDNKQINYISGHGNGKVYVALSNQTHIPQTVTVNLNSEHIAVASSTQMRVWNNSDYSGTMPVANGQMTVTVPANGMTALAIDDANAITDFQQELRSPSTAALHEYSYDESCEPFGPMTGMVVSLSPSLTNAFIYAAAGPDITEYMTLHYSVDGGPWQEQLKSGYPFEFSLPIDPASKELSYYMTDSQSHTSSVRSLWLSTTEAPPVRTEAPDAACPLPIPEPQPEPEPIPPVLVFSDDFEDGNADGWNMGTGNWSVELEQDSSQVDVNNQVYKFTPATGSEEGVFSGGDLTWTDYEVRARVKAGTKEGSGAASGIAARYVDKDNYYLLRLHWNTGGNNVQLMRKRNGAFAQVASKKIDLPVIDRWYDLKLEVKGSSITGYVDGQKLIEYSDDSFVAGGVGVRAWNQTVAFDDFQVLLYDGPRAVPLFKDDFEAGNADAWTFESGAWSVQPDESSNVLKQTDMSEDTVAHTGSQEWRDYMVEAQVKYLNDTTIISSGIVGRYKDINNYYALKLFSDTSKLQLLKKENGQFTVLKEVNASVNAGQWYQLKLVLLGSNIEGYVDGVKKISISDSGGFSSGEVGILAQAEQLAVDNVKVTGLYTPRTILSEPGEPKLELGGTLKLSAKLDPLGPEYMDVSWSSADSQIAEVTTEGLVTAVGLGSATLRMTPTQTDIYGPVNPGTVTLIVYETKQVVISPVDSELEAGQTLQLSAAVEPTDQAARSYVWSLDSSGVASVNDSGLVTAVSSGTARIRATSAAASVYEVILEGYVDVRVVAGSSDDEDDDEGNSWYNGNQGNSNDPNVIGVKPVLTLDPAGRAEIKVRSQAEANGSLNTVMLDDEILTKAFSNTLLSEDGKKIVVLNVEKADGGEGYSVELPAKFVNATFPDQGILLRTDLADLTLPSDMLKGFATDGTTTISIQAVDRGILSPEMQSRLGEKPLIDFTISVAGQKITWQQPDAPVTVSLPYGPTAEEQEELEKLTVWHISESGNPEPMYSARYDESQGAITFQTTHFSMYAVVFNPRTFDDLHGYEWARQPIENLAAKGIVQGVDSMRFLPEGEITRADYTLLLVRTLGLSAIAKSNFEDVSPHDYYYDAVSTASALGIVEGVEGRRFEPKGSITREQMFTMTERALSSQGHGQTKSEINELLLSRFVDESGISTYARASIASLLLQGWVEGDGSSLYPKETASRAEAVVLMDRLYTQLP